MKSLKTLRINKDLHDQLSKMSKKSKISITALSEIAIAKIITCSADDLLDVLKAKDDAYNKAIDRLLGTLGKKSEPDEYDEIITKSLESISNKEPEKKQEIKAIMPDKPATRIDTDHIESKDPDDGDINDILGGMDL